MPEGHLDHTPDFKDELRGCEYLAEMIGCSYIDNVFSLVIVAFDTIWRQRPGPLFTTRRRLVTSLEDGRLDVIMILSLWNLTGISAALLLRCLSNVTAIGKGKTWISRLRDFTRIDGKTPVRLVNRGPGLLVCFMTAPSYCLNWYWRIIKRVLRHLPGSNFTRSVHELNL